MQIHYLDEEPSLGLWNTSCKLVGSYVMYAVPLSEDKTGEEEAKKAIERCAAFCSLIMGEFVATERHFIASYDLVKGDVAVTGDIMRPIRQSETQHSQDLKLQKFFETAEIRNLSGMRMH